VLDDRREGLNVIAEQQRRVEEEIRFLSVVGVAMVASIAGLAVIAWVLVDRPGVVPIGGRLPAPLAWLGGLFAVALLVAAPLIHHRLLQRLEAPRAAGDLTAVIEGHRFATVLSFLLREAAAMIGLMVAFISGQSAWAYGLGAAAVVAMFAGWPRREELDELLRRGEYEYPPP
jgi:hypothetical protein